MKVHCEASTVGLEPASESDQRASRHEFIPLPLGFKWFPWIVDRLGIAETRRRILHSAPGFLPIGLPFIGHQYHWALIYTGLVMSIFIGIYYAATHEASVKRTDECRWMQAVWGYVIPIITAFVLFPRHPEFGLVTLQIVALGDTAAHLGGVFAGGSRLPWNRQKTFSGFFSFIVMGTAAATYTYWGEVRTVPIRSIVLVCMMTAFTAGIAESLPLRSSDNFRVGFTALLVSVVATLWWIGLS